MPADPDQRFAALAGELRHYDPDAVRRAQRYVERDRVRRIDWSDTGFSARVQGGELYVNRWAWDGDEWENTCTCPVGGWCKHGYAVARLALAARFPRLLAEPTPGEMADAPELARTVAAAARPAAPPTDSGLEAFETQLAAARGRKLTLAEKRQCARLAELFVRWRDTEHVAPHEFESFAAHPTLQPDFSKHEWLQAALDSTPAPEGLREFWQRVALALSFAGRAPAAEFAPLVDEARLQSDLARLQHGRAVAEWRARLRALEPPPPAANPPAGPRRLRLLVTARRLVWQAAAPGGEFAEVPVETVFSADDGDAPGRSEPSRLGWDARAVLLLETFGEAAQAAGRRHLTLRDPEVRHALAQALLHPDLGDAVLDASGAPFVRAAGSLVWKFTPDPEQPDYLRLALAQADGAPAPNGLIHLAGPPHVYLTGNVMWPGPAPVHDRPDAGWQVQVPREAVRDPEALRALVRSGAALPPEIRSEIEHVRLVPHLRVSLQAHPLGGEELRLAFSGYDDAGGRRLAYTPQGWTEKFRGARAPAVERAVVFDHGVTQPALEHFPALRWEWIAEDGLWRRSVHANTPNELSAWFAGFPAGTQFELAPELRALRDGPVRAAFDFNIVADAASRDWFDVQLAVRAEDSTLTRDEIALLMQAQGRWVRLEGKGWRRLALDANPAQEARLKELGLNAGTALQGKQRFHALQLAASGLEELAATAAWREVQERARAIASAPPPPLPAGLRAELRPYQAEGFHFLAFLARNSFGGILADDMGLGKTVQALAWLAWLAESATKEQPLRVLVVCPKSVTTNWERETARFTPGLSVSLYEPKRHTKPPPMNLLVANYAQLRFGEELFTGTIWTAVILDEAQNIKNPDSQTAGIARKLRARHRLVLTGTPIENRSLDLWSLFAFAMPGLLGGQTQFRRNYDDRKDPEARGRLSRRVRHFLLRRTKAQVAPDLPPRIEEDVLCELEGEQAKLYQAELKRARQLVLGLQTESELDRTRFNVLHSLLRLRQICCHPALLGSDFDGVPSAKVAALFDQLEPILEEGHKVLVFSQFVSMLDLLHAELEQRGIAHLMLTGQTENRQELVDRFQNEPEIPVFLLSLKAAGSGLNLTAASYVVLFDPWWNPAVEAQAIDRTHRIGQENQVIAYRLIAKDTVEEKIRLLQQEKAALARAVVQEESLSSVLDLESLRYVLG